MDIIWVVIDEFPSYSISNYGDVVNEVTGRLIRQSTTLQGAVKVNLFKDGLKYTKSVKVLVAEAFVENIYDEAYVPFDTPIHLDGDQLNNRADNLAWRSRSFAWMYRRQFSNLPPCYKEGPVIELDSQVRYINVYDAATLNGLLIRDVWRCINLVISQTPPTGQRFWLIH